MPKRYPKQARDLAVALYLEGLSVPEITKRFNDGTAGLTTKEDKPLAIGITERRVAEYIAEHKAQHGPRPEPEDEELTVDSINRVKQRALNVLAREVAHLEGLPKGRISAKQSTALRQHYATLDDMERRQEIAEKRKSRGKKGGKPAGEKKSESALERLAKTEQFDGALTAEEINSLPVGEQAGRQEGQTAATGTSQTEAQSQEQRVDEEDMVVDTFEGISESPSLAAMEGIVPSRGLSPEEISEIMGSVQA